MSQQPDTVSQTKNCLNIGKPFLKKDRFAVNSAPIVGSTAFTKIARRETLLLINFKAKEFTKGREQIKAGSWEDDIITVNGDSAISPLILTNRKSGSVKYQRLKLERETVPHRGELVPFND
jgi:hypothetical protein